MQNLSSLDLSFMISASILPNRTLSIISIVHIRRNKTTGIAGFGSHESVVLEGLDAFALRRFNLLLD